MGRLQNAPEHLVSYAFVTSMLAWMLVVIPGGKLADRWGTRPMLLLSWGTMALRLGLVALAQNCWQVVLIQFLDGFANGLFAVLAAAWVTERLADCRRVGEAQAIVGTSLVLGSGLGPACSGLVFDFLGYRGMFAMLTAIGVLATVIVALFVPETTGKSTTARSQSPGIAADPLRGDVRTDLLATREEAAEPWPS